MLDTLRFQWTKWVIEYDLVAQLSLFKDLAVDTQARRERAARRMVALVRFWPALAALAGRDRRDRAASRRRRALALAPDAAGAPVAATGDRPGLRRGEPTAREGRALAGTAAQTPRELAARGHRAAIADDVRELTELYYSAEWGGEVDPAAERRAAQLAAAIRAALDRPASAMTCRRSRACQIGRVARRS